MNTNVGYLFYKEYYQSLSYRLKDNQYIAEFNGKDNNERLFEQKLPMDVIKQKELYNDRIQNTSIPLRTVYPGLLTGSGYQHEILAGEKDDNNTPYVQDELKLGFYFDHTSGLPILAGSSVKGALRSAFKDKKGYLIELLNEILEENDSWRQNHLNKEKVLEELEKAIFEITDERCIYERDIFLDAFPIQTENTERLFLGNDFITPHDHPLKSPNPVQFLKVLPQVTYYFDFKLVDTTIQLEKGENLHLSVAQKEKLFQKILLDFGIGAKTNVGYGQFEELEAGQPELNDITIEDKISCRIDRMVFRENDNKYQIYLIPQVRGYISFLTKLSKPLPSIRVSEHIYNRLIPLKNNDGFTNCTVKRINDDGRIIFKDEIEFE
ncbi:MAG: type III-B CRISPR module RAMP protein Cmr6 [Flavobacteriales bacterium]|nr:type III-B CRISPR module RAMP protein Cmr6 [Flavobacteriales bacterium]